MIKHKRGDTFSYSGLIPSDFDVAGAQITSQIRNGAGQKIADLVVDVSGNLLSLRCGDTTGWPVGAAEIDIQFALPSGDIVSTSTERVVIEKDITRSEP